MGMMIDDNVKQKLLDKLSEEPLMVLSTAYVYAKNYVAYGEDITKAWTTVVQQSSILEKARQKAWVEAYDSFKKDYVNRLKADIVAVLIEIQAEIEELQNPLDYDFEGYDQCAVDCEEIIHKKIGELKAEIEPQESEDNEE